MGEFYGPEGLSEIADLEPVNIHKTIESAESIVAAHGKYKCE